jgi:uncharacterized damage-inducible protein DinB
VSDGKPFMTDSERARALALLTSSRDALLSTVSALDDHGWRARPHPRAWSPLDILEHLAIVERSVLGLVAERLPGRPPRPDRKAVLTDDDVVGQIEDRRRTVEAPVPVRPRSEMTSGAEAVAAFESVRSDVLRFASETKGDLRSMLARHAILGVLDAYQWLLFVGAHTNRHRAQIEAALRRHAEGPA